MTRSLDPTAELHVSGLWTRRVIPIGYPSLQWPQPITVQVYDGEVLAHCDHAGAYEDGLAMNSGLDNECEIWAELCDKCPAYREIHEGGYGEWHE